MNRLVTFIIFSIYLICIYGSNANTNFNEDFSLTEKSIYGVESRQRKTGHYFLYPYHGWYALSWIYWIKVKIIVVAFFVGTAFIWALQYIGKFYRHCQTVDHLHYGTLNDPAIVKFLQNIQ